MVTGCRNMCFTKQTPPDYKPYLLTFVSCCIISENLLLNVVMKKILALSLPLLLITFSSMAHNADSSWVRINQLGYTPQGVKVAVYGSKHSNTISSFTLFDSATGKKVLSGSTGKAMGAYGPFAQTYRLDFSAFNKTGTYYLVAGKARSPYFRIGKDVYKSAADFCLRYMRQQRSGFNPFLKDSCHMYDGFTIYGPMPDS